MNRSFRVFYFRPSGSFLIDRLLDVYMAFYPTFSVFEKLRSEPLGS